MAMHTDALNRAFAALADPTRRAILSKLAQGDADVSELAEPFELSQPAISKHLLVLERAGLVSRGRDGQRRPRTLIATPLIQVDEWMEPFRQMWAARFANLDRLLESSPRAQAAVNATPALPTPKKKQPRKPRRSK